MSAAAVIADEAQRRIARDPDRSVIVQAPAGSGKTELLMQRYLALLTRVAEPEEIMAVTFTRKAAAEMRHRILRALQPEPGDKAPLPETAELAAQVLARDAELGWRLQDFPARLRIRTLDSVNSWLTGSAPLSGEGTAAGVVTEQVAELYELAARRTLELVGDPGGVGDDIELVLAHLDNRAEKFIALLAQMLVRRDQWLPLLGTGDFDTTTRRLLEESLRELVDRELQRTAALLSQPVRAELLELLPYAAAQLCVSNPAASVCEWLDVGEFPAAESAGLNLWRALADFFLVKNTASGAAFRKSVNKNTGFPTPKDGGNKVMTDRAKELLQALAGETELAAALASVRGLPDPAYTDEQWAALASLVRLLPAVAAQLAAIFRERGETDYIEIANEAIRAFGSDEEPTELAMRLDYRINHILIDEFQDTSRTQFELLRKLTAGWAQDDGRTLFVVGDPMQSIYRFRQAEVALFQRLRELGIGDLRLAQVQLTSNFRSDPAIVEWVNEIFAAIMPPADDPATGAVRFAPGTPTKEHVDGCGVQLHAYADPARVDEAQAIAALVEQTLRESADDTVGILVRTRNQARLLVPELRRLGIVFSGAGLERPGETAVEQDLLALTRALSHLGDRTAWLALLRAPWCGLSLADLNLLCGQNWGATVLEQMNDADLVVNLSADGQARVANLCTTLDAILARKGRFALRDWVAGAWQELGGPATLTAGRELALAAQFFAVLDEYDEGGDAAAAYQLHDRLADREDLRGAGNIRVHLLTLFRAKGLEYDTVILPALDGTTRQDDKAALAWHEFIGGDGHTRYLMAPVEPVGQDSDPLQQLIRQFEKDQLSFERDRLMYVATTRAKKHLHLFFEVQIDAEGELRQPKQGSLLRRVWPAIESRYGAINGDRTEETREEWVQPKIRRFQSLPLPQEISAAPAAVAIKTVVPPADEERKVTYEWAGSVAMTVGSVVHRCLQTIAEKQFDSWSDAAAVRSMLREEGVEPAELAAAEERVMQALQTMLEDEQGRWILGAHESAASELPVTVLQDGRPKRLVIDRSFVDTNGDRWIIDYKTSPHEGGDLDAFIESEIDRYSEQLHGYRQAMQQLEPGRPIRLALYFPLLGRLSELPASG